MSFIQLNPSEYERVVPLIGEDERVVLPPTLGILEGIQPGVVFVDNKDAPTCSAVVRQNARNVSARLLGNPSNNAFCTGLVEHLQRESDVQVDTIGKSLHIVTATRDWEDVIYRAVGYRVFRIRRTQFAFDAADFQLRTADAVVPDVGGLVFQRIDKDLIDSNEQLTQYASILWNGADNYLEHGGGWVALEGDLVRGSCDAVFVGGELAELSIGVGKSLRGRGVGYYLAVQFIRDCLDKGLIPNWTCDTDNVASYQMAQKLAFTAIRGYYDYTSQNTARGHEPARPPA